MRNTLSSFFALSLVFLFAYPVCSGEPDKTLHQKCLYPAVQLYCENNDITGTAVIVRCEKVGDNLYHNIAITCDHVVRNMSSRYVYITKYKNWSEPDGEDYYPYSVITSNYKLDMAVIAFESDKRLHAADLGFDEKLYIGNDVIRVGCGLGDDMRVDYGKVTGVNVKLPSDKLKTCLRTNCYTVPGDSGGPLYHNNKVVGIMFVIRVAKMNGHMFPVFGMSYAMPISNLKKLDEGVNNTIPYAFDAKEPLPVIPFMFARFTAMKIKGL